MGVVDAVGVAGDADDGAGEGTPAARSADAGSAVVACRLDADDGARPGPDVGGVTTAGVPLRTGDGVRSTGERWRRADAPGDGSSAARGGVSRRPRDTPDAVVLGDDVRSTGDAEPERAAAITPSTDVNADVGGWRDDDDSGAVLGAASGWSGVSGVRMPSAEAASVDMALRTGDCAISGETESRGAAAREFMRTTPSEPTDDSRRRGVAVTAAGDAGRCAETGVVAASLACSSACDPSGAGDADCERDRERARATATVERSERGGDM